MKTTITILILLLTFSTKLFACECPEYNLTELDKKSYEWSDIIVIGEITKIERNYKIIVSEILKGTIENDILIGITIGKDKIINGCRFYPDRTGIYLLYLKKITTDGKTKYYSSQCSGTRLLNLEYYPVSLNSDRSKAELIADTNKWIEQLKGKK